MIHPAHLPEWKPGEHDFSRAVRKRTFESHL